MILENNHERQVRPGWAEPCIPNQDRSTSVCTSGAGSASRNTRPGTADTRVPQSSETTLPVGNYTSSRPTRDGARSATTVPSARSGGGAPRGVTSRSINGLRPTPSAYYHSGVPYHAAGFAAARGESSDDMTNITRDQGICSRSKRVLSLIEYWQKVVAQIYSHKVITQSDHTRWGWFSALSTR